MVKKIKDMDLDSIEDETGRKKALHNINLQENQSVASSLTFGSNGTNRSIRSIESTFSLQSIGTNKTKSTGKSITEATIENIIEPGMTESEIRERTEEYFKLQQKKSEIKKQVELEKFIQNRRKQEKSKTVLKKKSDIVQNEKRKGDKSINISEVEPGEESQQKISRKELIRNKDTENEIIQTNILPSSSKDTGKEQ